MDHVRGPGAAMAASGAVKLRLQTANAHELTRWCGARAAAGEPAPSNEDICVRFRFESTATAARLLKLAEELGLLRVERFQCSRRVTILSSGLSTAHSGSATRHHSAGGRRSLRHG